MTIRPAPRALLLTALPLLAACGSSGLDRLAEIEPDPEWVSESSLVPPKPIVVDMGLDRVVFTYLGAGGWLIEAGNEAIMTGPLFSNPDALQVLFGRIRADSLRIVQGMRSVPHPERVRAVLVGHGHYDHLMDVPPVVRRYTPQAEVYGSPTTRNLIVGAVPDPARVIAIETSQAATEKRPGTWFPARPGRFRWMAVRSDHSPHFGPVRLWKGTVKRPRSSVPERATDWLDGVTYAYLIDVLDESGEVGLRIHYNDSGVTFPDGYAARSTAPPRGVPTVAILTAPGHKWEPGYPGDLIRYLGAEYVLISHWENFLVPQGGQPRPTFGTFFGEFMAKMAVLSDVRWVLPAPHTRVELVGR